MREQFHVCCYNHLIKKLNTCNIPLSESEEYDIWKNSFDVFVIKGFTVWMFMSRATKLKVITSVFVYYDVHV